jgi:hypothetical protein
VFEALGHGPTGECPTVVDWRHTGGTADDLAANARAFCHIPTLDALLSGKAEDEKTRRLASNWPRCGWWWCRESAILTTNQWNDLSKAIGILRKNRSFGPKGIDPNAYQPVAYLASMYARLKQYARRWAEDGQLRASRKIDPKLLHPALLSARMISEWAAAPRPDRKRHANKPYHVFLNNAHVANLSAQEAGAILFLSGLGKRNRRLSDEIHRAAVAWKRGGALNAGRAHRKHREL